jgi:hypothetical protein
MENQSGPFKQPTCCSKYERLLEQCKRALLEIWATRREEAWQMGLRGKELGSELVRLQADFAKSYAVLQKHVRECALCEFESKIVNSIPYNNADKQSLSACVTAQVAV